MPTSHAGAKPVAVFLGPSLPREQAAEILDADFHPPARKGDVYRIMAQGVRAVLLIDGVFHSTPSVWHRELLDAMAEGIAVIGASSMGALRAAELESYGMIGRGTIYGWYRDGVIDGDDEVALLHAPAELGFRPLSTPLVNIRYTLQSASAAGIISAAQAEQLTEYARGIYYPDRGYERLFDFPALADWPRESVERLRRYCSDEAVDLKRRDAVEALRYCAGPGEPRSASLPARQFRSARHQVERLLQTGFFGAGGSAVGREVLRAAKEDVTLVEAERARLSKRFFVLEWAAQNGVSCPEDFLADAAARFERGLGADASAWLRANGLTRAGLKILLAERVRYDWLLAEGPGRFGLREVSPSLAAGATATARAARPDDPPDAARADLLERRFVWGWAEQNGVTCPAEELPRYLEWVGQNYGISDTPPAAGGPTDGNSPAVELATTEWVARKGPSHFGRDWLFEVALLHELQLSGRAARLAGV